MINKSFTYTLLFYVLGILLVACSKRTIAGTRNPEPSKSEQSEEIGDIPSTVLPDITIWKRASKICQLTGDYDKHLQQQTKSLTQSRYKIEGIDLGVPFKDGDRTWLLFGDTWGPKGGFRDALGYTMEQTPEDGLKIDFVTDADGIYKPLNIEGISQGAFEVPTEGIVIDDEFYVWHTTDHSDKVAMGRSVLAHAKRVDAEQGEFQYLYNFSTNKFINVSIVEVNTTDWALLPKTPVKEGLIIFGSGKYRKSHIYLAFMPTSEIKNKKSIRYFAGIKDEKPLWSKNEADAQPIYAMNNPEVGELSASYNKFIKKWILLYNHGQPRGINLRTADTPWGPWSDAQVIFHPWDDGGYCQFIHTSWLHDKCDNLHNPGRENEWGGEYGPYQFEHFATGDAQSTTIYFTMSIWNPYDVVLMKASLKRKN